MAGQPAVTRDGHRVEIAANVGDVEEARRVVEMGGEAIGLLRSEFLFLERRTAPTEDEQAAAYEAIIREVGPERLVVVRTLDVGGDKPLSYLPVAAEANPFLGERGIRLLLDRPELFAAQVRAILRASPRRQSGHDVSDDRDRRGVARRARAGGAAAARAGRPAVPVGIMIETAVGRAPGRPLCGRRRISSPSARTI